MSEEALFHEAIGKAPAERSAFLDAACAGQPELRAAVEGLLAAHDASGGLLDQPPAAFDQVDAAAPEPGVESGPDAYTPQPGEAPSSEGKTSDFRFKIEAGVAIASRYTLQEKIGEGGMGEVWVAKQTEPVKRRVALKLIKTGMDSRTVLGRFEQERQALAMMDYPNIARVLDGGMPPSGQPFLEVDPILWTKKAIP